MKSAFEVALAVAEEMNPAAAWNGYQLGVLERAIKEAREEGKFETLLERSSLGTPEVKAACARTAPEVVDKILARVEEMKSVAAIRHELAWYWLRTTTDPNRWFVAQYHGGTWWLSGVEVPAAFTPEEIVEEVGPIHKPVDFSFLRRSAPEEGEDESWRAEEDP